MSVVAVLELLTTREHLELYARIKGVAPADLNAVVDAKIAEVQNDCIIYDDLLFSKPPPLPPPPPLPIIYTLRFAARSRTLRKQKGRHALRWKQAQALSRE